MKNITDLQKEAENDWDSNPVKKVIQHLFSLSLSEKEYRKITPNVCVDLFKDSFDSTLEARWVKVVKRITNKLAKSTTIEKSVMILGEYLLSD